MAADGRTALIPVRLVGDDEAALPESARALIDHVETLTLPAGAPATVTGEWPV